ncbi:cytochrome b [Mangrovicoccus algicola]|uniref:cytochrome b n=1 Tax=Mangrovicoccus algicola TaxID=2771008 RepID=UPI002ED7EB7B
MTRPASLRHRLVDTPQRYGLVTRVLHWALALMVLWQLTGMGIKQLFGQGAAFQFFRAHHGNLGVAIFLLALLRVIWMVAMRNRRPGHGAGLLALGAKLGHGALYLLIVLVPLTAILRAIGSTRGFAPFGIPVTAPRAENVDWMMTLGSLLHGEGGWVLAALVAGHVAMVGLHEGLWRDGTLRRMAGRA